MKVIPVLSEKSLTLAKDGMYTFWVGKGVNKREIKKDIERLFSVHVTGIQTINLKGGKKRNLRGKMENVKARKKTVVTLKGDEKIDLFEEKKGK